MLYQNITLEQSLLNASQEFAYVTHHFITYLVLCPMICAKCAILSAISHLCYFSNLNNPKTFFCKVIKKSQCFLFLLSNNKILSLFVVFNLSATIQLTLIVIKDEFLRKIFLVQTVVHHNSSLASKLLHA